MEAALASVLTGDVGKDTNTGLMLLFPIRCLRLC